MTFFVDKRKEVLQKDKLKKFNGKESHLWVNKKTKLHAIKQIALSEFFM